MTTCINQGKDQQRIPEKILFSLLLFISFIFRFLINWRSCNCIKQHQHTRRSYQSFFPKTRGPFSFQFFVSSGTATVMRIWITSPIKKVTTTRPVKQKGTTVITRLMLILGCTNKWFLGTAPFPMSWSSKWQVPISLVVVVTGIAYVWLVT